MAQDWNQRAVWNWKETREEEERPIFIEEMSMQEVAKAIFTTWMIKDGRSKQRAQWQYSKPLFDALMIQLKNCIEENEKTAR
jgi:hypothetical protein